MKKLFVSASNRRGILIVIGFLLLIAFAPRIIMLFRKLETSKISMLEQEQIKEIENQKGKQAHHFNKKSNRFKGPPAKFNPNNYTLQQWQYLGLSQKQANIVLKFSKRGIDNYEELSKIFVIPPGVLELIKDSLVFENRSVISSNFGQEKNKPSKEKTIFDLNSSNASDLEKLPMIGEKLSARIIKYRDRLGGFVDKGQLLEVYGLDPSTFSIIESQITINKSQVKKLKLNNVSADDLKNHPYFNWNIANSIVKLRSQKGSFKKIEDILESKLIDLEWFEKVKSYLEL